jgi:hypothetical protein
MKQDRVIEAIKGSGGIMSTIARRLEVSWHTAYKYTHNSEAARQALADEEERTIDLAESTLLKSIETGNTQDAKWYLSTKGKHRGYSERHELTGANGNAFSVKIEVVKPDAD